MDSHKDGVMCLAHSNDRGRNWTKYDKNPVVEAITHYNRDPRVFWHAPTRKWIMAITLSCASHWLEGDYRFALLSSADMKTWREECRLEMPRGLDCPDLFELPVDGDAKNMRWVFWAAAGGRSIETIRRGGPSQDRVLGRLPHALDVDLSRSQL